MTRPTSSRAHVIVVALVATLVVAACQSQPAQLLTDPKAILGAAAATAATATSVRVDLRATGAIAIDPLGTGAGVPVKLDGTTATADIDIAGRDTRATFSVPGLLGIAGEIIAIDGTSYLKSTLTGPQYQVTDVIDPGATGSEPPEGMLDGLVDLLSRPGLDPVKGDDAPCAGGTCYTITIALTADELAALGAGDLQLPTDLPIPLPDLAGATVDLTIRVEQTTTRLSGLTADLGLGDIGEVSTELTFSKWGEPVSIAAPPPDQIAPAG